MKEVVSRVPNREPAEIDLTDRGKVFDVVKDHELGWLALSASFSSIGRCRQAAPSVIGVVWPEYSQSTDFLA